MGASIGSNMTSRRRDGTFRARLVALSLASGLLGFGALPDLARADGSAGDGEVTARIGASTYAKIMCSGIFVSGLAEQQIKTQDLAALPAMDLRIDRQAQSVAATLGSQRRVARHRAGLGCTLDNAGASDLTRSTAAKPYAQVKESDPAHPAPLPVKLQEAAAQAVARAFEENNARRSRRTRAVLVIKGGSIVAEQYAEGVDADTPLPGYSMAKGVGNLLVGLLVQRGWLSLQQDDLREEWRVRPDDARRRITVDQLLRMTSGLQWSEDYVGSSSDAMLMLTSTPTPGSYAASKPLQEPVSEHMPGEQWQYSSGDYAIVSDVVGSTLRSHGEDPQGFAYRQLFSKLGMTSAVLEATQDGNYFVSSFMLATARDWARLGLFLLEQRKGGQARPDMLPPQWLTQSLQPTKAKGMRPGAEIGSAFWVNTIGAKLPAEVFFLAGYQGQYLIMIPAIDLVVVRLATSPQDGVALGRQLLDDLVPNLH